jgi:predicted MFS family arabinose efflux permease
MRTIVQNAGFRRLWMSQVVLALGDALMQMGLLEFFRAHGYKMQTETAKLLFAAALPGAVLGPLTMMYLDRWQRRSVLIISDALRALIVVAVAVWLLPILTGRGDAPGLLFVYVMIFLIGAITTFYYPARYALIPNLVDTEKLIQANTLFTTSLAAAGVGGRALGGFVAERLGVEWAVLANALAYVASLALIWGIRMEPHATSRGHRHPAGGWGELTDGLRYLWSHPNAMPLVLLCAVFAFLVGVFAVAVVGYAVETLGLRTAGLGYLVSAAGTGAALGIVSIGRGGAWTKADWLPFAQLFALGVFLALLGATTNVWLAAALFIGLGTLGATVLIPIDAKLQEQVDDQRRGGVFAARGILTSGTMLVAFWLQFGSDLFRRAPAPVVLRWLGLVAALVAALALWIVKSRGGQRDRT